MWIEEYYMSNPSKVVVHVQFGTLMKVAAAVATVLTLWYLRDIAALVIIAIVLAILISPVADACERNRLPRALGVGVVYIVLISTVGFLFSMLAKPIIAEARNLAVALPAAWERVLFAAESLRSFTLEYGLVEQLEQFASGTEQFVATGIFGAISGFFGGALSFVLVLVLTFYLATHATVVRRSMIALAPKRWQPFLIGVVPRIERKMGGWLRGLLTLGAIMSVLVFIGMTVLGAEYAILIALLAGFAEVVPYVGAIIATVIAVVLTLIQSPGKALAVMILFIILQQLENHLLVPKVMQRAVGVHPVVSLIALLVGAKVGGVAGALLAIPIVAGIIVFFEEYQREKQQAAHHT
jgi:predicted PurR-regulated permease PerM